ncbi:YihY/virulence factor BrkB family protein [Microbacterium sp. nov. GSS16]|uniref:YihY/virulence factor BrkB family protein n=1 Tax=Microbacterium sp. nov. GSS16 TaxID=3019890 RepID=UPI0023052DFB|nr:YihY/virulence factor BrkB family protein [Microbacterium sp. nov. GSS16]WCD92040.1 YihY/virulence factor BrkB family protein [Microbacterium sp. nov. GSS16]
MASDARGPEVQRDGERRQAMVLIVRRVARGFFRTYCPDAAAGLTFYAILAMFPALIAAFSVIGVFGEKRGAAEAVLDLLREVAPRDIVQALRQPLEQVASTAGAGWLIVLALVFALWSVARYVTALGRAMNRIYGVPEGRMFWRAKPAHLLVTFAVFVLVTIACALAALSWPLAQALGRSLGAGEVALTLWRIARWPAVALVVCLIVAILYYFAPNVDHPKFRLMSVGALVAIAAFALASLGFGFYVSHLADYDRIYGSFAGVVIFLLWLWIGNIALLVGALFDAELERVRELRRGVPAERELQVSLRDTTRLEKTAENDVADERLARRLRRTRR